MHLKLFSHEVPIIRPWFPSIKRRAWVFIDWRLWIQRQPVISHFITAGRAWVCNGEIYNFQALAEEYDIALSTGSDCEVILPLFKKVGIAKTCALLDGVFAFTIVDGDRMYVGRDPIGIRALFIGRRKTSDGQIDRLVCSEMKGIHDLCDEIMPFRPDITSSICARGRLKRKRITPTPILNRLI